MIRRPPRSTLSSSSAASDVYKRQLRYWVSLFSRLNDRWAVRLKWTIDSSAPVTNYAFEPSDPTGQYPDQRVNWKTASGENYSNDIRVQLDYAF